MFRKKRQKNDHKSEMYGNCLNSSFFIHYHILYVHRHTKNNTKHIWSLISSLDYLVFLVVIPFLLIQSCFLLRLPSCLSHVVINTSRHMYPRFSHLVIHVVGLLLSLLWFHTHKTPWAHLPQDYTQWHLGKYKQPTECFYSSMSERI